MSFRSSIPVFAAALLLVFGIDAKAGIITSTSSVTLPGFSTGSIGPVGANPAPNNDNAVLASSNTIPYSIFFNSPGAAEVEFQVANSGGTTEYFIPQNLIVNNTGQEWTGFQFELGFGTGAGFIRSGAGALLDFDLPDADPMPFSSRFSVLDHQPDSIVWSGGTVPSVGSAMFRLSIDVPDNLQALNPQGLSRFTLRQTPITASSIPEPSSNVLTASALLALAVVIRKARYAL